MLQLLSAALNSPLLLTLLSLVLTPALTAVAVEGFRLAHRAMAHDPAGFALVKDVAEVAVRAAEQQAKAQGWNGPAKLEYATKLVTAEAVSHGVQVTPDAVRALIEAAVLGINQAVRLAAAAAA